MTLFSHRFFASQVHVALSSEIMGVGVVAGGPYFCALDVLSVAFVACMTEPSLIETSVLYDAVDAFAAAGDIDNPANLTRSKVYLLHGTNDIVVNQGVTAAVGTFYSKWIASSNIATKFDLPAAHSFVTDKFGNPCSQFGSPYINNCGFDGAAAILNQIYGTLSKPVKAVPKNVVSFDQSKFLPKGVTLSSASLDQTGYMYIPSKCGNNTSNLCRLHFAFHGCNQMLSAIGQDFVLHTGYNEVAEANNIIVVYPQTVASYWPVNNPEYALPPPFGLSTNFGPFLLGVASTGGVILVLATPHAADPKSPLFRTSSMPSPTRAPAILDTLVHLKLNRSCMLCCGNRREAKKETPFSFRIHTAGQCSDDAKLSAALQYFNFDPMEPTSTTRDGVEKLVAKFRAGSFLSVEDLASLPLDTLVRPSEETYKRRIL